MAKPYFYYQVALDYHALAAIVSSTIVTHASLYYKAIKATCRLKYNLLANRIDHRPYLIIYTEKYYLGFPFSDATFLILQGKIRFYYFEHN